MRIKSVSPQGVQRAFIPCGKCLECRLLQQFGWTCRFRLAVEALEKSVGCKVVFGTLTYNDEHLPHIPKDLVREDLASKYSSTPACFNRDHIRKLVKRCRDWLYDTYDIKQPTYMVCSEYGEHTQRPHYHFSFALPSKVDTDKFHAVIKKYWREELDLGFICPRDPQGDSSRGIKPFMASNNAHVVGYITKYCTKDLKFYEQIKKDDFIDKVGHFDIDGNMSLIRLSDYLPFHQQSRSLGKSFLDGKDESQLLALLRDGVSFVGESKLHALPKYYKDKILFKNVYKKKDDGTRLVRRKPNKFFVSHLNEVYEQKVRSVEDVCKKWLSETYWLNLRGAERVRDFLPVLRAFKSKNNLSARNLAQFYLSYFGVPWHKCRVDISFAAQWFCRFFERDTMPKVKPYYLIDYEDYFDLTGFLLVCHEKENDILEDWRVQALELRRKQDYIKQYHKGH